MGVRGSAARFAFVLTTALALPVGAGGGLFASAVGPPEAAPVDLVPSSWTLPDLGAASSGPAWRLSGVLPAGDVMLVGADRGATRAKVEVRTLVDGAWGPWTALSWSDEHGGDAGSSEPVPTLSEPVWTGPVEAFQFRTDAPSPTAVRLSGVEIDGGAAALAYHPGGTRPGAANAATPQPKIISRAEWGADERRRNGEPSYASSVRFAMVHHTANSNSYSASQSDDIVRSIYAYHTGQNGWDDIGYNFLVDRYGQVFEGRHGGIERAVIGAHAAGFNSGSTGMAVIGNFSTATVPSAAVDALVQLLSWKLDVHHVDPLGSTVEVAGNGSRFKAGTSVTLDTISGHRETGSTSCPGDHLFSLIDSGTLARSVAATGTPKLFTDLESSRQVARGDRFEARIRPSEPVSWSMRVTDADGAEVRRTTGSAGSTFTVAWDQRNARGEQVPAGVYRLRVDATASGRAAHPVEVTLSIVTGIPVGDPNATPVPPPAGAIRLKGDWNGDGMDTPGWFKDGEWGLHDRSHAQGTTTRLRYGQRGDIPVVGDWDGDGVDTVGVVRDGNLWILRNEYRRDAKDIVLRYGEPGDVPVAGDWDGNGTDTLGVVRGNLWILRNEYRRGAKDIVLQYGEPSDTKLVGDWDGDGVDTLGVRRGETFILRSVYRRGADDVVMSYGAASDLGIVGNWNGDRRDTLGVVRDTTWILRNEYRRGATDYVFRY
jgi:hypothetical protein